MAFLYSIPSPPLIASLSVLTDGLSYTVRDVNHAAFGIHAGAVLINGSRLQGATGPDDCRQAIVRPGNDTIVTYALIGTTVSISIDVPENGTPTIIEFEGGKTATKSDVTAAISMDADSGSKSSDRSSPCNSNYLRLPVWGPGDIGEEPRPVTATSQPKRLLTGKVTAYGQSVTKADMRGLLWMLRPFMPNEPSLYLAVSLDLPAGRLTARSSPPGTRARDEDSWWGVVRWNSQEGALLAELTCAADAIDIYPTAPVAGRSGQAEPLSLRVGLLTQMLNDPVLQRWNLIIAGVVLLLQLALTIGQVVNDKAIQCPPDPPQR
jgi:hypothetical protein